MSIRYTDLNPSDETVSDFVIRKRIPTWQALALMFICTAIGSAAFAGVMDNKLMFGFFLFLLFSALGTYVILVVQRTRDLILATEFQNALFAAALGFSHKFCLIARNDGTIAYLDRSFQDMFPGFVRESRRAIDALLERGQVDKEQRKAIFSAIERGVYDKVIFDIRDAKNVMHKIVMSVEPITRPRGFILLRGREFVEQRGSQSLPDSGDKSAGILSKSNISLFSHVMDSMNLGLYMTGPGGDITYANSVLEHWLGYEEGEITSRNLSLKDIIAQCDARDIITQPQNFEGDVPLQRKIGGFVKTFLNQKRMTGSDGQAIGYTALIHHLGSQSADDKKKLW